MTFEKAGRPVDITQMDLEEGPINRPSVGAVIPAGLARSLQPFICNVVFASVDQDHISWAAGTVTFADGGTQAIALSASQVLTATHYLYFDLNHASPTVLKISTTYSDCVGEGKGLIAVAAKGANANQKAYVQNLALTNIFINSTNVLANAITEPAILASAVTAVKISVATLDAISANVGTLTSGTINGVTIYAGSGAVVLDSSGISVKTGYLRFINAADAETGRFIIDVNGVKLESLLGQDIQLAPHSGLATIVGALSVGGNAYPTVTNTNTLGLSDYWWNTLYCLYHQTSVMTYWELSAVSAPGAGKAHLWVRGDAPNVLVFTDDTDTDHVLAYVA
uniref:Uncharacterized protein n=1 Tax=viral metagenome TaxID=1070528 RepID=A0A6M3JT87_9ZZZZ